MQAGSSLTTNASGAVTSELRYYPFGSTRYYTPSSLPTRYRFTGQYSYTPDFGLYYYGSRWYDPVLGRFTQADTIVPQSQGVQAWDRYAYTNNNPVRYTDPTGHMCSDSEDPTPSCDQNFHTANNNIHWDSRTQPKGLTKDEREAAEAAYLHALEDPQYFYDLFFNSDLSVWESAEVRSLDIYLQYSTLHTSADKYILGLYGQDVTTGSVARALNSGDPQASADYLEGLAAITIAGYGSSANGRDSWTTPRNATEQEAMDYAMKNASTGNALRMSPMGDGRWPVEEGWIKMEQRYGGVKIHYVWSPPMQLFDDFKFVK